ncbi:MAG TPA: formate dehydrogenase accessory sulfurtransferase FdhD [Chloroflexi bacterium]|jgi:FdhD protein|nr:formate dehydrogenase accessory sulfurtransferase FdhD [Chloroflexota bacterium]
MHTPMTPEHWPITPWKVWRIADGAATPEEIHMVQEEPLALHVNGRQVAVLMRLPGMEKELAAGFLVSEGLVRAFEAVQIIHHCGQGQPAPGEEPPAEDETPAAQSRNRIEVTVAPDALRPEARLDVVRLIRAGCGAVDVDRATIPLPTVTAPLRVAPAALLAMASAMRAGQHLHDGVGGVHAAALCDAEGRAIAVCEDVGRHNAVDKAVGHCLLRGIPLERTMLLCSGRLSYEMVTKVIRVGIPVLASVSTPTALAVRLAERFGLTVVGYLRGSRMTVYTHPERIHTG